MVKMNSLIHQLSVWGLMIFHTAATVFLFFLLVAIKKILFSLIFTSQFKFLWCNSPFPKGLESGITLGIILSEFVC